MYKSFSFEPIKGRILFVGNAVPEFSSNKGFYYLGANNSFWKILDYVFFDDSNLFDGLKTKYLQSDSDQQEIIKNEFAMLLNRHEIGLIDIIESCEYDDKSSALDRSIIKESIIFNQNLIKYVSDADVVFLNGKGRTLKNFKRALGAFYKEIKIKCYVLPSSSNACAIKNKKMIWKEIINSHL